MDQILQNKRFYWAIASAAIILYLFLAMGSAWTYRPEIDEGFFASPAVNLLTRGSMGTPVVESAGSGLKNIEQHTYWVMPLHLLVQAGWYKFFGFSLFSMRTLSAFWGLIALLSWFFIMRALSKDKGIALLTLVLLSVDYLFIVAASLGRMDMMSASLGFAAFAAYLNLRERDLRWAILAGQSLVVASGLTHPNGILHFAGLLFLILYFDRRKLKWQHVGFALLPYVVGALGWGFYILKDPSAFIAQFTVNSTMNDRMGGFRAPWLAVFRELTWRYGRAFGLGQHSVGHSGPIYLKSLVLLAYAIALAGALLVRRIREHRGYRALLILTGIYFIMLTMLDGQKETPYLIHIIPMHVAMLAVWLHWCWTNRLVPAPALVLSVGLILALQVGGLLFRMKQDTYHKLYMPTISFIQEHSNPSTSIIGTPALGFGMGFRDNFVTDVRLGYFSGKKPDLIVVADDYEGTFEEYRTTDPTLYRYITGQLTQNYQQVYENPAFKVYARR